MENNIFFSVLVDSIGNRAYQWVLTKSSDDK